jgi:hypothetical protein
MCPYPGMLPPMTTHTLMGIITVGGFGAYAAAAMATLRKLVAS